MAIVETKSVGPEYAAFLLEGNSKNRPISKSGVEFLSRQMKEGLFKYNGDTIRIDRNGNLLDGQHRLSAIVMSGTTHMMTIIGGLDPETFSTIDQGRKRTTGDLFAISGSTIGNHGQYAAASKVLLTIERKLMPSSYRILSGRNDLIIDCFKRNEKLIRDGMRYAHRKNITKIIPKSAVAACFAHYAQENYSDTCEFFEDLSSVHPKFKIVSMLKDKMQDNKASKQKMVSDEIPCLLMKALKKHLSGQEVKILRFSKNEEVSYADPK